MDETKLFFYFSPQKWTLPRTFKHSCHDSFSKYIAYKYHEKAKVNLILEIIYKVGILNYHLFIKWSSVECVVRGLNKLFEFWIEQSYCLTQNCSFEFTVTYSFCIDSFILLYNYWTNRQIIRNAV